MASRSSDPFVDLDATAQAALVRNGEASPSELVDAAIARVESLNPQLNAVIAERFDAARVEAAGPLPSGPFQGVPILLKDLGAAMAGEPLRLGNSLLGRIDHRADVDSHLVTRLKAAGFVILGRTNTPEFGATCTTEPVAAGPTRNPWDTERSAGGSSGGSAAAVAARMVPVAHASDGGGSIRIPASECGVFGLKPSRGRISRGPQAGEGWAGASTDGVVSLTVRDTAGLLDILCGWEPGDPYTAPPPRRPWVDELAEPPGTLRIGVHTEHPFPGVSTDPEVVASVQRTAELLGSLGHEVAEAAPPALLEPEFLLHYGVIVSTAMARQLLEVGRLAGREVTADDVEAATWASAENGRATTGVDYLAALEWMHAHGRRMASWWRGGAGAEQAVAENRDGFDLLLTPTIGTLPPPIGHLPLRPGEDPVSAMMRIVEVIPFTAQFNTSGQPAMSLPVGWSDGGLPIGSQLAAADGREDLLLRVAAQVEQAEPWAQRRPPTSA